MRQIVEEHASLWRIQNEYQQDAEGCDQCREFWQRLANDKQEHIDELTKLIKTHLVEDQ